MSATPHVLLIEDEPNIAEAIRFLLSRDGLSVTVLDHGAKAMAVMREKVPALVILDLMLPDISGLEILTAMRGERAFRGVPVLMLTAKGQARDREAAEKAGASLFMAKPFANAELMAAVRQLLGA
ncbi:response regulator transcription factor [Neogemmobacter tilapiae]|uniref:Response regulator n=1 Tax=Neogemmobacter tilapiae TaxID=875041 RepID=A0A918TRF3_9RHOB|nr:response regulator [Gemmobacter tilapiae]GHC57660.1 response regulator [Gemmobacter tilapiae]